MVQRLTILFRIQTFKPCMLNIYFISLNQKAHVICFHRVAFVVCLHVRLSVRLVPTLLFLFGTQKCCLLCPLQQFGLIRQIT